MLNIDLTTESVLGPYLILYLIYSTDDQLVVRELREKFCQLFRYMRTI